MTCKEAVLYQNSILYIGKRLCQQSVGSDHSMFETRIVRTARPSATYTLHNNFPTRQTHLIYLSLRQSGRSTIITTTIIAINEFANRTPSEGEFYA